jgi:hypothetical protein
VNTAPAFTVNEVIALIATPVVVVPLKICKLPNDVKIEDGKAFVAFIITVPLLGVQVFVPVPPNENAPFIVNVLPLVMVKVPRALLVAFPSIKLPAVKFAPLTNVIVPLLDEAPAPPKATTPETDKLGLPLVANVKVPVLPELTFFPKVRLAHSAFVIFTVTENPPSIYTSSSDPGNTPDPTADPLEVNDHVVLLFQLPVALE